MRIILDECVPRSLKRQLASHDVHTVPEMGRLGKKNGELLALMIPQKVEVFATVDQNLRYQQDFRTANIAAIVLMAPANRIADLLPLMPSVHAALATIQPGDLIEIRT